MTIFSKRKYSILLALLLAVLFCLQAQEGAPKPAAPAQTDETAIVLGAPVQGPAANGAKTSSSPSTVWILIRIVLVLALVCAGIYGVVYLLKKSTKIDVGNDPYLKNVASLSVGPNRSIQIITAGEQAFMVGITEHSINLISEITDKELIDTMNLDAGKKSPVPGGNFTALVSRLLPKKAESAAVGGQVAAGESKEAGSTFATTDFLRKQRERLNGSSGKAGGDMPSDGGRS